MSGIDKINEAAEKEYPLELWTAEQQIIRKLAFRNGALSDAANQYWYAKFKASVEEYIEQFKASQKQSAGVMKNIPEKIYLQTGLDIDEQIDEDFNNLDLENICWSRSKVFETDIEYTLTPQRQSFNEDE